MPLCHVRAIQIRAHAESRTRRREGSLAPPSSVPLVLLRLYLASSGGRKSEGFRRTDEGLSLEDGTLMKSMCKCP